MTELYIIKAKGLDNYYNDLVNICPEGLLDKIEKKKIQEDRIRSLLGYIIVNKYTNGSKILFNEFGKPYKDNSLKFSISHSHDFVVVAISDDEVGVDIELVEELNPKLVSYCLNDSEIKECKSKEDFYLMWTSKESLAKCIGTGLRRNIKEFNSLPLNGIKKDNNIIYTSKCMIYDKYALSVTARSETIGVKINELTINEIL